MTLNYVTLDLADGTGAPRAGGFASLAPSAQLTDTADDLLITQAPIQVPFTGTPSSGSLWFGPSCMYGR